MYNQDYFWGTSPVQSEAPENAQGAKCIYLHELVGAVLGNLQKSENVQELNPKDVALLNKIKYKIMDQGLWYHLW